MHIDETENNSSETNYKTNSLPHQQNLAAQQCMTKRCLLSSTNEIIFSNSSNLASAVDDYSCNKRVKLTSSSFFKGNLQLKEYLEQSAIGRSLLDEYRQKSTFNSSKRSDFLHLIVDSVINNHDVLRGSMANDLSLVIVERFPNECREAYYYPRKPSKEKLWWKNNEQIQKY